MKITKLFTGTDNKSHFIEIDSESTIERELGRYSKPYPASGIIFRDFDKDAVYSWHNAPQPQYIVYLEGEVEIETSSGEKRVFKAGDILFATDLTGQGHITKTLTKGRAVIITT